jgi:hypothetical protein
MDAALSRIRRFSTVVWAVGTIGLIWFAFATFPTIGVDPRNGQVYVDDRLDLLEREQAWLADDPQEFRVEDGVLHGSRQGGFLRLEGGSDLLLLSADRDIDGAEYIAVHQQTGTVFDVESDEWEYPDYLGGLWPDDGLLVMPAAEDGLLWFGPSLADWSVQVTTPPTQPIDGTVSGTGNAVLLYEGPALSGRFQHVGTGLFQVSAVTVGESELLVNEIDDVDVRRSWPPTDRVAFFVEADTGEGSWTITLDTPASDPPASDPP